MAKKGKEAVLQEEINNDEDWSKILEKSGVCVIDVYAGWCGPCIVMIRYLKKIKMDLNTEILHFAIAKSDNITALKRFRQKSQPTWIFLVDGKMVNLCIGVKLMKLMKLIEDEVEMYDKFKKGEIQRKFLPMNQITEEERREMIEVEQYREKIMKVEKKMRDDRLTQVKERYLKQFTENVTMETYVIYYPHTIKSFMVEKSPEEESESSEPVMVEERICEVADSCTLKFKEEELFVIESKEVQLTKEMLDEVFFMDEEILESLPQKLVNQLLNEKIYLEMLSSPIVQKDDDENFETIEQRTSTIIYGHDGPLNPSPDSLAAKHMLINDDGEKMPSMYTPTNPMSKVSALVVLFEKFCAIKGYVEPQPPLPQYLVIFEINKSNTVLPIIENLDDKIVHYGFFRSADPENPRLLCKDPEVLTTYGLDKLGKDVKLVLSVLKDEREKSLLLFVNEGPIYVSPNTNVGINDAINFFPPDFEDMEGEVKTLMEQQLFRDEEGLFEGEEEYLGEEGEEGEEVEVSQL